MAKKVAAKKKPKGTKAAKSAKSRATKSKSSKAKSSPSKPKAAAAKVEASVDLQDGEIAVNRRMEDRRHEDIPVAADRRKVQRRRQIDPTTCERDYSNDEIEFMQAMDAYKRTSGRMFPTCSEILEVLRDLNYVRLDEFGNPVRPIASAAADVEGSEENEDTDTELAGCDSE